MGHLGIVSSKSSRTLKYDLNGLELLSYPPVQRKQTKLRKPWPAPANPTGYLWSWISSLPQLNKLPIKNQEPQELHVGASDRLTVAANRE